MIRIATTGDDDAVKRITQASPCLGAGLWVQWQLWKQNTAMPCRFYLVGENALLECGTPAAVLVGTPKDNGEAEAFLAAQCLKRVESDGWHPAGWRVQPYCVMERPVGPPAGRLLQNGETLQGTDGVLDKQPPAGEVLGLLEAHEGPIQPPVVRDALYSGLCARRNHSFAEVWGARQKGVLVATAGVWADTGREAYIACVETLPAAEGKGYASALLQALCAQYAARCMTLLCKQRLTGFYSRFGFAPTGKTTLIATEPQKEE